MYFLISKIHKIEESVSHLKAHETNDNNAETSKIMFSPHFYVFKFTCSALSMWQ